MIKLNNFIILFIIILFNCILINNGYLIKNITPGDIFYRQYSGYSTCSFQYYVLCTTTESDESCDSLTISTSTQFLFSQNTISSNDTSSVIYLSLNPPPGDYSILINGIALDIFCYNLDLNNINFKLVNNYFYYLHSLNGLNYQIVSGIFEISGSAYDPAIQLSKEMAIKNNYYINVFSPILFSNKILFNNYGASVTDLRVNISSYQVTKEFKLDSFGTGIYDNIYDIKTYPDSQYLSNLKVMGNNEGPVLSFTSNNSVLNGYYLVSKNGISSKTQYFPISGNESSTTYLYSMMNGGLSTANIISYYSDSIFKNSNSIQSQVSIYTFEKIKAGTFTAYPNGLSTASIGFEDVKLYEFQDIIASYEKGTLQTRFPFGYIYHSSINGYKFKFEPLLKSFVYGETQQSVSIKANVDGSGFSPSFSFKDTSFVYDESKAPIFSKIELVKLQGTFYIYRLRIIAPYGLGYIMVNNRYYSSGEVLVSGDLYDGIYEVLTSVNDFSLIIYDIYDKSSVLNSPTFIMNPFNVYMNPFYIQNCDPYSIQDISFLYNDLNVTNRRHYNVIYFNYPSFPKDTVIGFSSSAPSIYTNIDASSIYTSDQMFFATFNESISKFQIEFYVDPNQYGTFPFFLWVSTSTFVFSDALGDSAQLRVNSKMMDLQGPVITKVIRQIPDSIISDQSLVKFGWILTISDSVNGFDYGYITIQGSLDKSIYNFTIHSNDVKVGGDFYLGEYDILLNISSPCISQSYQIVNVELYDRVGRYSLFSKVSVSEGVGVYNPFLNLLNDTTIYSIPITCTTSSASSDTTAPLLVSFNSSLTTIDVGKSNRQVTFTFSAQDLESGLKNYQYPIVYISSTNRRIIECKSTITSINSTFASYECTVNLPVSFGYPNGQIILSVYGFINNNGLGSGFTTTSLLSLGFTYSLNTIFTTNEPIILDSLSFSSKDNSLWLIGRALWSIGSTTTAYIKYFNGTTRSFNANSPSSNSNAVLIKIDSIDKQFQVYLLVGSLKSNTITINPIVYDYYLEGPQTPTPKPTETSTPTPSSTFPPAPTNSPQSCQGNPVCGGPLNGKCLSTGCVCYSPWVGIDCLSQIAIIDPPIFNSSDSNTGSPSISIIVPDVNNSTNNNNDNSTTTITYKSLISIIALQEINIYGASIYSFEIQDDWVSRQIENLTFVFYKDLEINKNNQISTVNITVTLKWFTQETNITFADEQLLMNPSTMKYTIEVGNYPFDSALNQLQLVMSASIQSNSNDSSICSVRQYGETTSGDNSNYLKIQVDNHSLYGRFIRRGIVDSTITKITNVLLDKEMNPITSNNQLQSYIGIQIPNYKYNVSIDPDFSILVDSSKADSICSNKSKLSGAKIAGIVIGCTACLAVVVVIVTYFVITKKRERELFKSLSEKMKRMNNTDNE